jgi:hypothetical protein
MHFLGNFDPFMSLARKLAIDDLRSIKTITGEKRTENRWFGHKVQM